MEAGYQDAPSEEGIAPSRQFDISKIDFALLGREFARAKKKNLILEDLDDLIWDTLRAEVPECYNEVSISGYRQKIYEYVYTRYPDVA